MMLLAVFFALAAPLPVQPAPAQALAPGPPLTAAPDDTLPERYSLFPQRLSLSLGPELGIRRVSYRDRVSPGLAAYQSGAVGLLLLSAEIFPTYGKGLPVVSDIGLLGSTSRSLRARADFSTGAAFDDQWHAWDLGARWRAVFSGEEWGSLSLRYGSLSSMLSGPPLYNVLLPTGTIQYWRPGLELRFPIGLLSLAISGGYLDVVVQDALGHAFPRASQAGIDAGLAVSFALSRHIELHLSGRYIRFFYSLNPQPGDPFVAGGALDEYAVVELGLSLRG
jgi:hypothetical protein